MSRKYLSKDGGEDTPALSEIFDKQKILLYQNESLDLDHYYQEPYQDENDEIKEMGKPFETDESKKTRSLDLVNEDRTYSGFGYFMDGSRRTYKIGDTAGSIDTLFITRVANKVFIHMLRMGHFLEEFCEGKSKSVNLELQLIMVQLNYIEQTGHGMP